jgi:hypothetical protein
MLACVFVPVKEWEPYDQVILTPSVRHCSAATQLLYSPIAVMFVASFKHVCDRVLGRATVFVRLS